MVERYTAISLQVPFWVAQTKRDYKKNLEHIAQSIDATMYLDLSFPIKLIALPEGSIQGFADELLRLDHVKAARELMIEIPGPETEALGQKAKEYECYIVATARALAPEVIKDRYFNVAFIIDPKGEVIYKRYKLQTYTPEPSLVPHDVWDRWVEVFGTDLNAFYPVADTEIGRIGALVCYEGSFPETARGLAMNGAEIITRVSYPEPWVGEGWWEIQNRARALDNTCYVIAVNSGLIYFRQGQMEGIDMSGGNSMIIDYRGNVTSRHVSSSSSFAGATIDIEQLRDYRSKVLFGNWLKELRTEQYKLIYEEPIYPKNLYLSEVPPKERSERNRIYRQCGEKLLKKGIWVPPSEKR